MKGALAAWLVRIPSGALQRRCTGSARRVDPLVLRRDAPEPRQQRGSAIGRRHLQSRGSQGNGRRSGQFAAERRVGLTVGHRRHLGLGARREVRRDKPHIRREHEQRDAARLQRLEPAHALSRRAAHAHSAGVAQWEGCLGELAART